MGWLADQLLGAGSDAVSAMAEGKDVFKAFFDSLAMTDLPTLIMDLQTRFKDWIKDQLLKGVGLAVGELTALFAVPGLGVLRNIYKGIVWFADNADRLATTLKKVIGAANLVLGTAGTGIAVIVGLLISLGKQALDLAASLVDKFLHISVESIIAKVDAIFCSIKKKVRDVVKGGRREVVHPAFSSSTMRPYCKRRGAPEGLGCTSACFVGGTPVDLLGGMKPIQQISLTALARTAPVTECVAPRHGPGDEGRLRLIDLFLNNGDGSWTRARLLREQSWLNSAQSDSDGQIWLNLPEMTAVGWARVVEVEACPPLPQPRPGFGLVTGWFEHSRGVVYLLWIEGEPPARTLSQLFASNRTVN